MLTEKQRFGMRLEQWTVAVVKSIFKRKNGYRILHNDWDDYTWGRGLDVRVFERNKQTLGIECKHLRDQRKPYGTQFMKNHILHRFTNFAGGLKLLVITFLSMLTKEAKQILDENYIYVIELGTIIDWDDFPRKGRTTKLFYKIKDQLLKLIQTPKKLVWHTQSSMVKYPVVNVVDNVVTHSTTTTEHRQHEQRHDINDRINHVEHVITHQFEQVRAIVEAYFKYGKHGV